MRGGVALVLASVLYAAPAAGQLTGDYAVDRAKASRPDRPRSMLEAHASFGRINRDFFLTTVFRLNYNQDYWGIGLQLPIRILLEKKNEKTETAGGIFRKEDWNDWTDALRLFNYAYVGRADRLGPFFLRGGLLEKRSLGHGSVMHRYYNGMDINRWRVGINTLGRADELGGELILGDVLAPYLWGVRGWVRPFRFRLFRDYLDRLEFGTTLAADWRAPLTLQRETNGVVKIDPDSNLPLVAGREALAILGIDVGMNVFKSDYLSITPYTDINMITAVDEGWGVHLGVLWETEIPTGEHAVQIALRTEYRRVSGDYLAPYFNTVYEIERYQRLRPDFEGTKLSSVCAGDCSNNTRPWRNSYFFELQGGLKDVLLVGSEYIEYSSGLDDGSFRLYVEVPYFDFAQLRAFYFRVNLNGAGDLFALDERTALVAELHVPIYYVGFRIRWWRTYQAVADQQDPYQPVDDWNIGVIVRLKL
jgi:hypothetical protein